MPTTEKARVVLTITDLGYAPITAVDEDGKPTYGAVKWLPHHRAGGRTYDAQPAGTATGIWADSREVYAAEDNQGYNNTVTTVGVTDDVEEDWYGRTVNANGSVEEYADVKEYPGFALVIIEDTTDGQGKTTIFYNSHISQRSATSGATSEGNGLNPQFPQHVIAHRPRMDCMCVKKEIPAKTKITTIPEPSAATPHISIAESTASVSALRTAAAFSSLEVSGVSFARSARIARRSDENSRPNCLLYRSSVPKVLRTRTLRPAISIVLSIMHLSQ